MKKHSTCCVALLCAILSQGCGDGIAKSTYDTDSGNISIEIPSSLNRYLIDSLDVYAELVVNNRKPQSMSLDRENLRVKTKIKRIKNGDHTLRVDYFTTQLSAPFMIASAYLNMSVKNGKASYIDLFEFKYTDSDNDGISNIAELNFGTAPYDPVDTPPAFGIRSSQNYVVMDDTTVNSSASSSTSANYTIQ